MQDGKRHHQPLAARRRLTVLGVCHGVAEQMCEFFFRSQSSSCSWKSLPYSFPSLYQPALDSLWDVLSNNLFYCWSTFETIWTVFCYAIIELYITFMFVNHPE